MGVFDVEFGLKCLYPVSYSFSAPAVLIVEVMKNNLIRTQPIATAMWTIRAMLIEPINSGGPKEADLMLLWLPIGMG